MRDAAQALNGGYRIRFGMRSLLLIVGLFAVFFGGYARFDRQYMEPRRHAAAVEKLLESLVTRRPGEMTPRQWESAMAWTLNLHGNSLLRFEADSAKIGDFRQRLSRKLAGPVKMDTIHWIWDQYADICAHGASYQRFRPVMIEEIEAGGANWSMNVK